MRSAISFAVACVLTLALFYLMQLLITGELRDPERPTPTPGVRLVMLHRTSATGPGGQSQPPTPASAPPSSASAPAQADSDETPSDPLPTPNPRIESPPPTVAPVDAPPVRRDPPVTVAKQPALPQTKPDPSEPKVSKPPPTRKSARKSAIAKKKPPAALPEKPPEKLPAAPQKEFRPRRTADRESSQTGAGSRVDRGAPGGSGNAPPGASASKTGAGSGPGGSNTGASGDSPVGILSKPDPVYPRSALQRGQEGWVKVSFTITEQGRIENPAVVSSRPRQIFDQAALEAIMRWRFRPKMVSGKPVQTNAIQEIRFRLPR